MMSHYNLRISKRVTILLPQIDSKVILPLTWFEGLAR